MGGDTVAGKVTVGLALHWSCVTDFSGLNIYGLGAYKREMSTPPMLQQSMAPFASIASVQTFHLPFWNMLV